MNKKSNIRKIANAFLVFLLLAPHVVSATEDTGLDPLKEKGRYSETRLQELEVVYKSALDEIEWVLENYSLGGATKEVAITTTTLEEVIQPPKRETAIEGSIIADLVKAEQERQIKAKEAAEEIVNEAFKDINHAKKIALLRSAGQDPGYSEYFSPHYNYSEEYVKVVVYLQNLLGHDPTGEKIWGVERFGKIDPVLSRPTEAQLFAMGRVPSEDAQSVLALAQRYVEVKVQLLQKLSPGEELTQDQIFEGVRQQDNLKITDLTLNPINEGLRLKRLYNKTPSWHEIEEALRLQGIEIESPNMDQITVGLLIEKKNIPEEVYELEGLYIQLKKHLRQALRPKEPSPHEIVKGIRLRGSLGRMPSKEEFFTEAPSV